jgi:RHS repeat-associated protein
VNTPAYDAFGNLLNIYRYDTSDVLQETQTFGYDLLDRLTSAAATGGAGYSESYSYDASTGSLASKTGVGSYAYHAPRQGTCTAGTNAAIPHAAQTAGANAYTYDCNGNMLTRPGQALTFDAENRLVEVNRTLKPTRTEASFTYDGDGTRVKSVVGSTTTVFIGEYLEWTGSTSTMKLHYYAGGRRIALRSAGTLLWLTGDHLGSTTVTADASGGSATTQFYKAWGDVRTGSLNALATRYTFTGQAAEDSLGLMYYHARWYDPLLGRFISADTIVPNAYDPLAHDRYAYVRSNPLRFVDPSGHKACIEFDGNGRCIQDPDWHTKSDIPAPQYYECSPMSGKSCISEYDEPFTMITHTIFGEGGSLSKQAAANVLQTILNRAYIYWTTHHAGINSGNLPWEEIDGSQLTDLLLFILSEPYWGSDGKQYPSYNAWGTPEPRYMGYWKDIHTAVKNLVIHPGIPPSQAVIVGGVLPNYFIRNNVNVIYYGASSDKEWKPSSYLVVDAIPENYAVIWQYYGTNPINP